MTTNDLDQAREWAKDPSYQGDVPSVAAARVIASLPDEWIDTDKLREVIERTPIDPQSTALDPLIKDLRALLPTPTPRTMDEIEWSDEEHHLLEATATWVDGAAPTNVIMLSKILGAISAWNPTTRSVQNLNGRILTPTGRKFKLTPLQDLPHMAWPAAEDIPEPAPTKLVTVEDYHNAPVGTIVGDYLARRSGKTELVWQKLESGRWWKIGDLHYADLAGKSRVILRWGEWSAAEEKK